MPDKPETPPGTRPDLDADAVPRSRSASAVAELSISKVLAGGLAAATSAVLGSHFGASGTVGGAALGSIVTTVGASLYQRSLERARDRVARQVPLPHLTRPNAAASPDDQTSIETGTDGATVRSPLAVGRWIRVTVVGALLFFGLGLGLVTGIEWAKGSPLSGGLGGTSVGRVLAPAPVTDRPSTPAPSQPETSIPETSVPTPSPEPSPFSDAEHPGTSATQHPMDGSVPTPTIPTPTESITPSAPLPLPGIGLPGG
jgi:hypothetical protein